MAEVNFTTVGQTVTSCAKNLITAPGRAVEGVGQMMQPNREIEGLKTTGMALADALTFGATSEIIYQQKKEDFNKFTTKLMNDISKELAKELVNPKYFKSCNKWEHSHPEHKSTAEPCEVIFGDPTKFPLQP